MECFESTQSAVLRKISAKTSVKFCRSMVFICKVPRALSVKKFDVILTVINVVLV